MLKPDFFENRPPAAVNLTTNQFTAHVQVIAASPTRIRRALLRNVYMVTTQAGSKRLYCNTIARLPARIVVGGGST